jgi:hypothetical protein
MVEVNYSIILNVLIIIAIAMIAPIIIDMYLAYKRKQRSPTTAGDSSIAGESNGNPVGMPGLYRTIMTFSIILILAGLIFYFMTALTTNIASINTNTNMTNATASVVLQINRDLNS